MFSANLWSNNLYLHVKLYLYLFNEYLFCIFSSFNRDRAKFNKSASLLAFVLSMYL